ncbi:hypothetical protein FrCorBMG51_16675 [Protofrankia coriariae]|uniref:NADPH-dependent FMN reductase n=2 Tax=Protofrankia coriariae TaxID=1562887 RepID=A0ABR5F1Q8_9ACTN|nr:hypothetical protein FrCorBMG51_16675 [Protofrankia coriariae]
MPTRFSHLSDVSLHWAPRLRGADDTPEPPTTALQDGLVAELLAADTLLLGAPMYTSHLRADRVTARTM